jgi:hypothetical protein
MEFIDGAIEVGQGDWFFVALWRRDPLSGAYERWRGGWKSPTIADCGLRRFGRAKADTPACGGV